MAYSSKNFWNYYVIRLIIGFSITAVMITGFGLVDVAKDAFGSHRDIRYMEKSDFKSGDIVHGIAEESLGYAASIETTEYTMHVIKGNTYTSGYYYVIPYFKTIDDAVPEKIIMYKTGNKAEIAVFEDLIEETYDYYYGDINETCSHVNMERAEVCEMNAEEKSAFEDFVYEFVDVYFENSSSTEKIYLQNAYKDAMVPYLLEHKAETGNIFLPIGLAMLGILVILIVVYIIRRNKNSSSYSYVQTSAPFISPNSDPNLNSPTGLKNASDIFYSQGGMAQGPANAPRPPAGMNNNIPGQNGNTGYTAPRQSPTYGLQPGNKYGMKRDDYSKDYSRSERPLPPVGNGANVGGTMMYDPQTGMPIYTQSFGTVSPTGAAPVKPVSNEPSGGDSMPSVDPASEENVDMTNGGMTPDEKVQRNAVMPHNGNIPVINPNGHNFANMFGVVIPQEPTESVRDAGTKVDEIHPATSDENISADFQVEETDKEMRNMLFGGSGGDMNAVDPYTEKNVDVSNGGIEIEEEEPRIIEMKQAAPIKSEPAPTVEELFAPIPDPAAAKAAPAPEPPAPAEPTPAQPETPQPAESSSYNIFGSGNKYSSYTSSYTGGSSYNIFKKDAPPAAPGTGDMGFPVTEKDFPKPDNSFPEAGQNDVGGKDDFVF